MRVRCQFLDSPVVAARARGVLTAMEFPSTRRPEHKVIAFPSRMRIVRSPPIEVLSSDEEEVRSIVVDRELEVEDDLLSEVSSQTGGFGGSSLGLDDWVVSEVESEVEGKLEGEVGATSNMGSPMSFHSPSPSPAPSAAPVEVVVVPQRNLKKVLLARRKWRRRFHK
ncbi:hypothetical protein EXIGLDRAFT_763183 [Exidia glandulosa HHB12029]|uniref:Uncharacterized protein n=1 Tax=Exidia glandulosa HHB12029 TaxID=1314781 RepID=A0A165M9G0_EXIGL|nr:hypothetical protein EXIGLDRAFT_763183 [Exidia glandulosa HHB12029]